MLGRMHRGVALGAVAAGLLVAGCGNQVSGKPPQQELSASVTNLGENKQLSVTVALDGSPSDLQALSKSGGTALSPTLAGLLAAGTVSVEVKSDKKLSELNATNASGIDAHLVANVDGGRLVELTSVNNTLYLRADVRKLLQLANRPSLLSELQSRAATLPAFVKAGLEGQWVSISGDAARGLLSQLGGATPNAAQQRRLLDQVKAVLDRDVTATRVGQGGAKGDHLVLTGNVRKLGTDLVDALSSAVPGNPAASQLKPADLPDKPVTVDAWVKDGQLSEVSVDLVQLASANSAAALKGRHVPLVMTFSSGDVSITAPSAATPVDLSQILPLVGALSSSSRA